MRAYQYEVTEQSPAILKETFALGTKFNAENAVTLAEAVDASRPGGAFFPDEAAVIAKAEAQRNISAVHAATRWVAVERKAGRTPSAADVEAKIAGFRYEKVTVRDPNAPKVTKESSGVIVAAKKAAAAFDAGKAALTAQVLDGKFGATALDALVAAGMLDVEQVRAVAAEKGGDLPPAVRKLLGA